jgi:hypothetical protein
MSPYILSISYKISYKDFLYGGNPGVSEQILTLCIHLWVHAFWFWMIEIFQYLITPGQA